MKKTSLAIAILVLTSTFYLALTILPVNVKASTLYVGGTGPGNYTTIQSAIDNAAPGDAIYVFNGVYPERIEVNKTLSLVGEDRNETMIDGTGMAWGYVVNVSADWVNFTGFKVMGNSSQTFAGIHLFGVQDCFIANNNVSNLSTTFRSGILLAYSNNNTVANNVLWNNSFGIELAFFSDGNDIVGNTILSSRLNGIQLSGSDNNTIANNFVSRNNGGIKLSRSTGNILVNNTAIDNVQDGIYLRDSTSNVVIDNDLSSNHCGIWIFLSDNNTVSNNNAWDNDNGIWLSVSDSNAVTDNLFTLNNQVGIRATDSNNNTVADNYVWNNKDGINLYYSHGNSVADNLVILNSLFGIRLNDSNNNTIHHNNIINNSLQAGDDMDTNQWDDGYPSGGNYWSDYTGVDVFNGPNQDIPGSDGMGDTPYVIDADSEDRYPLVAPVPHPPSAPLNLSAFPGDQQIALTWDPPSFNGSLPITNYRIYRGTAPGGEVFLVEIGNVLTHLDTGLTNGQMYCYRVSAVNGVGEGPLSNEACATPTATPGAPVILQADLSGSRMENVTVKWDLSSDDGAGQNSVVGYSIYRGTSYDVNAVGYQPVATVPSGTIEYNDNMVGEGDPNNYFYRICAVDLNSLTNCSVNQAGKFTRSLMNGPNLLSIPLIQSDENIETVLQTVKWDKAWSYDSSSQTWKSHVTFKPYKGELDELNVTMGIWVNVMERSNLTVAGIVPSSTSIYLHAGWNLLAYPSFNLTYLAGDLKAETGATRVEGFDPSAPPYFLRALADGDILRTGFGYWVRVVSETSWTIGNS
ncbi:MAG: right-handed parallel beta-helix repeat-containing protein [Thermoplasmata archaeon]|nr:right-handed parallel beta-helix repeat-containing protein [Thermoplasmata archaeon]